MPEEAKHTQEGFQDWIGGPLHPPLGLPWNSRNNVGVGLKDVLLYAFTADKAAASKIQWDFLNVVGSGDSAQVHVLSKQCTNNLT